MQDISNCATYLGWKEIKEKKYLLFQNHIYLLGGKKTQVEYLVWSPKHIRTCRKFPAGVNEIFQAGRWGRQLQPVKGSRCVCAGPAAASHARRIRTSGIYSWNDIKPQKVEGERRVKPAPQSETALLSRCMCSSVTSVKPKSIPANPVCLNVTYWIYKLTLLLDSLMITFHCDWRGRCLV